MVFTWQSPHAQTSLVIRNYILVYITAPLLVTTSHHMASTSWCSVRNFVRWSRDPVTILTTPPGRSDVSNTWVQREWMCTTVATDLWTHCSCNFQIYSSANYKFYKGFKGCVNEGQNSILGFVAAYSVVAKELCPPPLPSSPGRGQWLIVGTSHWVQWWWCCPWQQREQRGRQTPVEDCRLDRLSQWHLPAHWYALHTHTESSPAGQRKRVRYI